MLGELQRRHSGADTWPFAFLFARLGQGSIGLRGLPSPHEDVEEERAYLRREWARCDERPSGQAPGATQDRRPAAPRQAAFWLMAFILTAAMLGTTLPTPLYDIYQAQWHLSATMVTVIFAIYALAVLVTLLLAGRSSGQAGRRPVLAVALGLSALSTVAWPPRRTSPALVSVP